MKVSTNYIECRNQEEKDFYLNNYIKMVESWFINKPGVNSIIFKTEGLITYFEVVYNPYYKE